MKNLKASKGKRIGERLRCTLTFSANVNSMFSEIQRSKGSFSPEIQHEFKPRAKHEQRREVPNIFMWMRKLFKKLSQETEEEEGKYFIQNEHPIGSSMDTSEDGK
jgi:hypothetical protein